MSDENSDDGEEGSWNRKKRLGDSRGAKKFCCEREAKGKGSVQGDEDGSFKKRISRKKKRAEDQKSEGYFCSAGCESASKTCCSSTIRNDDNTSDGVVPSLFCASSVDITSPTSTSMATSSIGTATTNTTTICGSSSSTTTSTTTIATHPSHFFQEGYISSPPMVRSWYGERRDRSRQQPSSSSTLPPRIGFVNETTIRPKAKIARFYSEDTSCGGELRVIEPLLLCDGDIRNQIRRENETSASLAAIWGAPYKQHSTIRKLNPVRKPSSWEESVLLERRRSIAAAIAAKLDSTPLHQLTTVIDTKDLRYCFQHPYLRLFTTMLVTFCNFLLFAEDPISHSQAESTVPLAGNVFSFMFTKYPQDWRWALVKVLMWIFAILCGLVIGKLFVHNIMFGRLLRLKMFRDEQGSWIAMFLTVILSVYTFSYIYNFILYIFYNNQNYFIDSSMGITNSTVMKACACGTWLGDLITWLMVTDVMLQDSLYPGWAVGLRSLWRSSNLPRILVFWCGSALATALVVTLIVSDYISWDTLNRDFVASTELSRAFLASLILVLDLVIMMQDWDFPHFTTTVHINLPGFSVSTLKWKYAEVNLTGKWFNYGVIFMVMMLDLNMWKNQIFYYPDKFGQYIGPNNKIHTVSDQNILKTGNDSLWSWEFRSKINQTSGLPYYYEDMKMNSMFLDYPLTLKCTAFIPSIVTLSLFISLVYLYGRFPHKKEENSNAVGGGEGDGAIGETVTV